MILFDMIIRIIVIFYFQIVFYRNKIYVQCFHKEYGLTLSRTLKARTTMGTTSFQPKLSNDQKAFIVTNIYNENEEKIKFQSIYCNVDIFVISIKDNNDFENLINMNHKNFELRKQIYKMKMRPFNIISNLIPGYYRVKLKNCDNYFSPDPSEFDFEINIDEQTNSNDILMIEFHLKLKNIILKRICLVLLFVSLYFSILYISKNMNQYHYVSIVTFIFRLVNGSISSRNDKNGNSTSANISSSTTTVATNHKNKNSSPISSLSASIISSPLSQESAAASILIVKSPSKRITLIEDDIDTDDEAIERNTEKKTPIPHDVAEVVTDIMSLPGNEDEWEALFKQVYYDNNENDSNENKNNSHRNKKNTTKDTCQVKSSVNSKKNMTSSSSTLVNKSICQTPKTQRRSVSPSTSTICSKEKSAAKGISSELLNFLDEYWINKNEEIDKKDNWKKDV